MTNPSTLDSLLNNLKVRQPFDYATHTASSSSTDDESQSKRNIFCMEDPANDVDDGTNFRLLASNFLLSIINHTDMILCRIADLLILAVFMLAPIVKLFTLALPVIKFLTLGYVDLETHSLVNLMFPKMISAFKDSPIKARAFQKLATTSRSSNKTLYPTPDYDLAQLFIVLSSVVYENNAVHNKAYKALGFEKYTRILHEGCVYTLSSQIENGVNVMLLNFKGTSPYNLNEWLEDFKLDKTGDAKRVFTYRHRVSMHEGFYLALTNKRKTAYFSDFVVLLHEKKRNLLETFQAQNKNVSNDRMQAIENGLNFVVDSIQRQELQVEHADNRAFHTSQAVLCPLEEIAFLYRFYTGAEKILNENSSLKVNFWVTGHSMGAGLGSAFSVFLSSPFMEHSYVGLGAIKNIMKEISSNFQGAYLYGTPKVLDSYGARVFNEWLEEKNVPFFRFRNGNDIVGVSPPLAMPELSQMLQNIAKRSDGYLYEDMKLLSDFSPIQLELRLNKDWSTRLMRNTDGYLAIRSWQDAKNLLLGSTSDIAVRCFYYCFPFMASRNCKDPFEKSLIVPSTIGLLSRSSTFYIADHATGEYARSMYYVMQNAQWPKSSNAAFANLRHMDTRATGYGS